MRSHGLQKSKQSNSWPWCAMEVSDYFFVILSKRGIGTLERIAKRRSAELGWQFEAKRLSLDGNLAEIMRTD